MPKSRLIDLKFDPFKESSQSTPCECNCSKILAIELLDVVVSAKIRVRSNRGRFDVPEAMDSHTKIDRANLKATGIH
jgi:hypothetical protein